MEVPTSLKVTCVGQVRVSTPGSSLQHMETSHNHSNRPVCTQIRSNNQTAKSANHELQEANRITTFLILHLFSANASSKFLCLSCDVILFMATALSFHRVMLSALPDPLISITSSSVLSEKETAFSKDSKAHSIILCIRRKRDAPTDMLGRKTTS